MKERQRQRTSWGLFIPAFILLGIGCGLLSGRPDVGALAGLGTGFIAMGIAKMINSPETGVSTLLVRSAFSIVIGAIFIIAGLGLVYFPAFIWPYIGALVLIIAGTWLIFMAATRHEAEKPEEDT